MTGLARAFRAWMVVVLAAAAMLGYPGAPAAAPRAEPWERWRAHDDGSVERVDHGLWAGLLQRHLHRGGDGIARFDYGAMSADDRTALAAYLAGRSQTAVSALNRREQMAFWINLYNALTISVVREHYPVDSIRDIDISPGLFSDGPWGRKLIAVEGEPLSLDDIEHRILRPLWGDARVHYAVNCASLGCPDLAAEPYAADRLEAMLEAGARAYVNHPRGAAVEGGRLSVSSIYNWFQGDFGGDDAGVIAHLRRFAAPPLARALQEVERIAAHRYDWRLNDRAE